MSEMNDLINEAEGKKIEYDENTENLMLNVIADGVQSRLVRMLQVHADKIHEKDQVAAILLRYAAGSIEVKNATIQFLRYKLKEK